MTFNLISNLDPAKGLCKDAMLLRAELEALGHKGHPVDFREPHNAINADVNIYCETLNELFFGVSDRHWYIPNPEWHFPWRNDLCKHVELIWCKTQHAYDIFHKEHGAKCRLMGFISEDRYREHIKREPYFLHLCGTSQVKNTTAVIECWARNHIPATLLVVGRHYPNAGQVKNVIWHEQLPEEELTHAQNTCLFHLLPSQSEGWGHALHEGMSTGNLVLTTNAEPMNEFGIDPHCLIDSDSSVPLRAAKLYSVKYTAVQSVVNAVLGMNDGHRAEIGKANRALYLKSNAEFRENLKELVG